MDMDEHNDSLYYTHTFEQVMDIYLCNLYKRKKLKETEKLILNYTMRSDLALLSKGNLCVCL